MWEGTSSSWVLGEMWGTRRVSVGQGESYRWAFLTLLSLGRVVGMAMGRACPHLGEARCSVGWGAVVSRWARPHLAA